MCIGNCVVWYFWFQRRIMWIVLWKKKCQLHIYTKYLYAYVNHRIPQTNGILRHRLSFVIAFKYKHDSIRFCGVSMHFISYFSERLGDFDKGIFLSMFDSVIIVKPSLYRIKINKVWLDISINVKVITCDIVAILYETCQDI